MGNNLSVTRSNFGGFSMLTYLTIFIFCLSTASAYSKILPDPIIGERCEDMANRRKEKYQYKQRVYELLIQNRNMRAQTPRHKEKLLRQLYKIHNDLNQRRHLIEAQLKNLEEEIIRKGCPGISVGDMEIAPFKNIETTNELSSQILEDTLPENSSPGPIIPSGDENLPIAELPEKTPELLEDISQEDTLSK